LGKIYDDARPNIRIRSHKRIVEWLLSGSIPYIVNLQSLIVHDHLA